MQDITKDIKKVEKEVNDLWKDMRHKILTTFKWGHPMPISLLPQPVLYDNDPNLPDDMKLQRKKFCKLVGRHEWKFFDLEKAHIKQWCMRGCGTINYFDTTLYSWIGISSNY